MEDRRIKIKKFFENDKILGGIAKERDLPALDIYGRDGAFLSLIEAVISQQLSGKAANSIYKNFEKVIKSKRNVPKFLSEIEISRLREIGVSNSKARCIISVSKMVNEGEIDIENLKNKSEEEIKETLTKVKGIGIWTVNMFLMFGLKREDVWPCTDYGIRKNLSIILKKKEILSPEETEKAGQRWKPYRSYASCYIWNI